MFDYSWLLGQAAFGLSGTGQPLGSLGSYALHQGYQDMSAAQQAGSQGQAVINPTPAISNKDYKDQKIKYSKFKECENPIKPSELTYRG